MDLGNRLDEIVKEYGACLLRALSQISYDHPSVERSRNQAVQAIKEAICEEEEHNWRLVTELNNPGMDYCNRCKVEVKASKWKRTSSSHLVERHDIE